MSLFFFQAEDGIRDGTVTGVQTCALPIYPRCSQQFNLASSSRIGGFIGSTNSAGRRAAIGGGPVANEANIPFGDRFFQTLVFSLCDHDSQFVRLKIETRIDYLHTAAKDADVLG